MTLLMVDQEKVMCLGRYKDPGKLNDGFLLTTNPNAVSYMTGIKDEASFKNFIMIVPDMISEDLPIVVLNSEGRKMRLEIDRVSVCIETNGHSIKLPTDNGKKMALDLAKTGSVESIVFHDEDNLFKPGCIPADTFVTAMSVLKGFN